MTEFHKALMAFWQSFGVPVYLSGCVDDQAAFPYFTIDVELGSLRGQTILTAHSWHRRSPADPWTGVMSERLQLMDAVQAAIPAGGRLLTFPGGYAILNRNDDNFIAYVVDADDPDVIGGRVSYEVRYFFA